MRKENLLSVYVRKVGGQLAQTQMHIYGSSKLGMATQHVAPDTTFALSGGFVNATKGTFIRGEKLFELSNHLGNVLATLSDRRQQNSVGSNNVDSYTSDIQNAQDFYPGGMFMPLRQWNNNRSYRYGFNDKEMDNEISNGGNQYDYGFKIYDPRIVRFKSVDPLSKEYAWNSPYSYAEGDMIRSIDLDGLEKYVVFRDVNDKGELERIRILTFTDKDGNLRDNMIYKRNTKLKKADVYVITENINTHAQIGKLKYQNTLTADQKRFINSSTLKNQFQKSLKRRTRRMIILTLKQEMKENLSLIIKMMALKLMLLYN